MVAHYRVDTWDHTAERWEPVIYETSEHSARQDAQDRAVVHEGVRVVRVDDAGVEDVIWEAE